MALAGMTDGQRVVLVGLLALWGALLFGGFVVGARKAARERRMPTWTRMLSSLALVVAAWVWAMTVRDTPSLVFSVLIATGMTLGCAGDLALAGLLRLRQPLIGGIAAFGLGHVAYIAALVGVGNAHGLTAPLPRYAALGAWLLVGLVGWYAVVARGRMPTLLHRAALPYALLLAGTAGVATGLALQATGFLPVAAGAALFLASDLVLAGQLFAGLDFPLIGDVIWLTYGPAQALVVYGANAALLALSAR